MFLEERHQQILELLDRHGRVAVPDLARRFKVTEDCIRKDLKQLVADGKCRRVYGGATKVEDTIEINVSDRLNSFLPEKQAIAQKAIDLLKPHQTVFLDISTTNLCFARLIAKASLPCTVVSPMIDVHMALAHNPHVKAICPGGTMHGDLNGFVGAMTVDALSRFRFDLAFCGAYGLDIDARTVSTYEADDGLVKHAAIERASKRYLVCESRKLGVYGNYTYADFDDFDALICDDADKDNIELVREAGLDVL